MYGRFQAPGMKWGGKKAISSSTLGMQRAQKVSNLRKRGREGESEVHIPAKGQKETSSSMRGVQPEETAYVMAATQGADAAGTASIASQQIQRSPTTRNVVKHLNKVQGPKPKPKPKPWRYQLQILAKERRFLGL